MSEKKVVVFIVEGPSDEAALGTIMKEFFSSNEVQFIVVHGDITLKDYVSKNSILKKLWVKNFIIIFIYNCMYIFINKFIWIMIVVTIFTLLSQKENSLIKKYTMKITIVITGLINNLYSDNFPASAKVLIALKFCVFSKILNT